MQWIVFGIIGINTLVYLLVNTNPMKKADVFEQYALMPGSFGRGEWYRSITAGFLHGDILHLLVNMYSLFVLYPAVMNFLGLISSQYAHVLFILLYVLCLLSSGLVSNWRKSSVASVGASGAIFGLLGFLLIFGLLSGNWIFLRSLLLVVLINFGIGFVPGANLDNWGHLGGLVGGLVFGLVSFIFIG